MTALAPLPIELDPWLARDDSARLPGYIHRQWIYRFTNNFGASVVQGTYTYGGPDGLYELAVIIFSCPSGVWAGNDRWDLAYDTPITDDVLGYLSIGEVAAALARIAALPGGTG